MGPRFRGDDKVDGDRPPFTPSLRGAAACGMASQRRRALITPRAASAASGATRMQDLLWLGVTAGLALLAFGYLGLCDRA